MGNETELNKIKEIIQKDKIKKESARKSFKNTFRKFYLPIFEEKVNRNRLIKYFLILIGSFIILNGPIIVYLGFHWIFIILFLIFIPLGIIMAELFLKFNRLPEFNVRATLLDYVLIFAGVSLFAYIFTISFQGIYDIRNFFAGLYGINVSVIIITSGHFLIYRRLNEVGLIHFFVFSLLVNLENRPIFDRYIARDFNELLKNLDKWYFETLGIRIKNFDEILDKVYSQIGTNISEFQTKVKNLIIESKSISLKEFNSLENLSNILKKLGEILDVKIGFTKETISTYLSRNFGKFDTIVAITMGILSIISYIITI